MYKTMKRMKLVAYVNVTGNKEMGYTIKLSEERGFILVAPELSGVEMTTKLIDQGILGAQNSRRDVRFDRGYVEFIQVEMRENDYPLCRLEYIEDVTVFEWAEGETYILPKGYELEVCGDEVTGVVCPGGSPCFVTEDMLSGKMVLVSSNSPSVELEEV